MRLLKSTMPCRSLARAVVAGTGVEVPDPSPGVLGVEAPRRWADEKLLRMTAWGGDMGAVEALVSRLEQDPLFVMSLGSKELFHSNLLAWLMERFPVVAEAVTDVPGAVWVAREASHTDLLVQGDGRRPLVVENKVFSLPDETQLSKIADSFDGQDPELLLLSLTEPLWDSGVWRSGPGQVWRWMGYGELASRLRSALDLVRSVDAYVADTMERWLDMIGALGELAALVGHPTEDEALMLPGELRAALDRVRLDPGIQKMRFFHVAALLRARGIETYVGLSNRTALIESFTEGPEGITFGWQLQGTQFRLALIVPDGHPGEGTSKRHLEARFEEARRWPRFFEFGPIAGGKPVAPADPRDFRRYNPNFLYRYVQVPQLTVGQAVQLGVEYADRTARWCAQEGRTGTS